MANLLVGLSQFQGFPGVSALPGDPSAAELQAALDAAAGAVEDFVGRTLSSSAGVEFYSGSGRPQLPLRRRPVTAVAEVRLDTGGYFGDAPGAFDATSVLTAGVDYALDRDQPDGSSRSGLLLRLGGSNGAFRGGWGWPGGRGGTLAGGPGPAGWPEAPGCLKVTYTAGYATTPQAVVTAVCTLAAWIAQTLPLGGQNVTQESLGEASYTQALQQAGASALSQVGALGSARQLLARYRDLAI